MSYLQLSTTSGNFFDTSEPAQDPASDKKSQKDATSATNSVSQSLLSTSIDADASDMDDDADPKVHR